MMNRLLPGLPPGYYLVRDPDTLALHRRDGSLVAVFSVRGAAAEEVERTAETDGDAADDAGPCMKVRFFGRFEVWCEARSLPLGRNAKVSAILKYLLAHRERSVSRDYLMEWLWPESNAKRARGSLNTAIHSLRAILERCPLPAGCRSHVVFQDGHYRLCEEVRFYTDVEEFDARCRRGRALEGRDLLGAAVAEYESAVELYRGDYLSEDLYEEWTMIERQRLTNSYLEILDRLSGYYAESGQYEKCIRACYKLLEKEPYYENSHRLLMYSNVRLGFYARALQQYRLYERMLRNRFDAEPSPELKMLLQHLLGGERRDRRTGSS
jgi:DNA-binding SARP family transcriptional activator